MHPHFVFSFVTPARELLWKVSSGPRSEKVARLNVTLHTFKLKMAVEYEIVIQFAVN